MGDLSPGDVIADRYRVRRLVGAGGMGAVYEAEQLALGRKVALKIVYDEDPVALRRFEQEARALARLDHPNVVGVFDFILRQDGPPLLVMQLLEGESLYVRIKRRRLEVKDAITITTGVLRGLEAIHERGIVHRDLKPSNIFLTLGDVKIVDFGIAKLLGEPGLTSTDAAGVVGTPSFLSPEQLRGEEPDARTDLHALGVCLHVMLTGESPWRARAPAEVAAEILRDAPPSVREKRPDVPEGLAAVIARALAKDRKDRFASASEMRSALSEPKRMSTQPLTAPPTIVQATLAQTAPTRDAPRQIKTERLSAPPTAVAPMTPPISTLPLATKLSPLPATQISPVAPTPSLAPTPSPSISTSTSPQESPRRRAVDLLMAAAVGALVAAGIAAVVWANRAPLRDPLVVSGAPTAAPAIDEAHVFRGPELEGMVAGSPLNGDAIFAQDCYCLPVEVAMGKMNASPALHCPRCAGVDVNGSWKCSGKDSAGEDREGRYLCRGLHRMGPAVQPAGSPSAATLQ